MRRHLVFTLAILLAATGTTGLLVADATLSPETAIALDVIAIILVIAGLAAWWAASLEPHGQHRKDALHALPAAPVIPDASEHVTEVLDVQTFSQHATEVLTAVAPRRYGHADVTPSTTAAVEALLDGTFHEWQEGPHGVEGLLILTADGLISLAHLGDRVVRDEDGLHVWCTQAQVTENVSAYPDWETGEFAALVLGEGAA